MRAKKRGWTFGKYSATVGVALVAIAVTVPADAQFAGYPATWPTDTSVCPQGGTDCWIPITRFSVPMQDQIAGSDDSKNTTPQPAGADIFNGELGDQESIWYAFDAANDVVFLRKRLDGTPTIVGSYRTLVKC